MPADLTRAEKAAFARLDEIMPGWQTEPGAIHGHEIRAVVTAVRPHLYREAADGLERAGGPHPLIDSLRAQAAELDGRDSLDTERRCPSCEHTTTFHQPEGCWYTVVNGRQGANLVCPCRLDKSFSGLEGRGDDH